MLGALGDDHLLPACQFNGAALKIAEELAFHDIEEFIVFVVMVPVVLTFEHSEVDDRVVDLTERLIVPLVFACVSEVLLVHNLERLVQDV